MPFLGTCYVKLKVILLQVIPPKVPSHCVGSKSTKLGAKESCTVLQEVSQLAKGSTTTTNLETAKDITQHMLMTALQISHIWEFGALFCKSLLPPEIQSSKAFPEFKALSK